MSVQHTENTHNDSFLADGIPKQDRNEYDSLPTATATERILAFKDSLLAKWELPKDRHIQEEEFLCLGRYGQISRATLIQTSSLGPSLSVVLKKLPGEQGGERELSLTARCVLVGVLWTEGDA